MNYQIPASTYDRFQITFGATRSIIYDLQNCIVFHLNNAATIEIQRIYKKRPMSRSVNAEFLAELTAIGVVTDEGTLNTEMVAIGTIPAKPLKKIWIELTNRCNQNCVHCYASSSPHSDDGLGTEQIIRFLNGAISAGCESIQFTGGEPLLRKDLPLFCDIAQKGGIKEIEVFSNLSTNNKTILSELAKLNIIVSTTILAHDEQTHNRLTRSPGAFKRMVSNVKYLHSLGVPVNASIILTAETEDRYEEIIDLCNRLCLKHREPDAVRPFGRGADKSIKCKRFNNVKAGPYFETTSRSFVYAQHFNSCWGNMLFLRYDGKVAPCPHAREFVFGDIANDDISSLIAKALPKAWTLTLDKVEVCNDCEFRYLCTDCRPLAYEGDSTKLHKKNQRCLYDPYKGEWNNADLAVFSGNPA